MISCPCALVISIPLGYFGGAGLASRQGILVKGSNFLDALSKVKTVVFDKTGTLTRGNFAVRKVEAVKIARRTRTIVWQNIVMALAIKIVFVALGTIGMASMWEAVFADMGVALAAIVNSTRALRGKGRPDTKATREQR